MKRLLCMLLMGAALAACGQPLEKIKKDTDRDHWMQAEEAKAYGLVGRIVKSQNELR
jgi:ATP-dependent Clp protease protease subunit